MFSTPPPNICICCARVCVYGGLTLGRSFSWFSLQSAYVCSYGWAICEMAFLITHHRMVQQPVQVVRFGRNAAHTIIIIIIIIIRMGQLYGGAHRRHTQTCTHTSTHKVNDVAGSQCAYTWFVFFLWPVGPPSTPLPTAAPPTTNTFDFEYIICTHSDINYFDIRYARNFGARNAVRINANSIEQMPPRAQWSTE